MVHNLDTSAVWFVTGSSIGLGRSFASQVYNAGHKVVATARNTKSLSYLPDDDARVLKLALDVTSEESITSAIDATIKRFGRLDVVINNAGYGILGDAENVPDEASRKIMETNFWGAVKITQAAVRVFREVNKPGQGGTVVQVTSVGGAVTFPSGAFYHASKFALEGFTKGFAQEVDPAWNIKFLIAAPGGVKTNFVGALAITPRHPAYDRPEMPTTQLAALITDPKLQETMSDPDAIAEVVFNAVSHQADRPLPIRLSLGPETPTLIKHDIEQHLKELKEWETETLKVAHPSGNGNTLEILQSLKNN